jgi:hypoxanthine phosphoribosyltransferase
LLPKPWIKHDQRIGDANTAADFVLNKVLIDPGLTMKIYSKADTSPMSWEEYGTVINKLFDRLVESGLRFDAMAPIIRSGSIPGSVLAIRLRIVRVIPLQFKYWHNPTRLEQMISMPSGCQQVTDPRSILICENNTSTGNTARAAVQLLKEHFPKSKLYYATVTKVFGGPDDLDGVERYFFGTQTNERFLASPAQMEAFSLRPGITIFPWECAEDELTEINNSESGSFIATF